MSKMDVCVVNGCLSSEPQVANGTESCCKLSHTAVKILSGACKSISAAEPRDLVEMLQPNILFVP